MIIEHIYGCPKCRMRLFSYQLGLHKILEVYFNHKVTHRIKVL